MSDVTDVDTGANTEPTVQPILCLNVQFVDFKDKDILHDCFMQHSWKHQLMYQWTRLINTCQLNGHLCKQLSTNKAPYHHQTNCVQAKVW